MLGRGYVGKAHLRTSEDCHLAVDGRRALLHCPVALHLQVHRLDGQVQLHASDVLIQGRVNV